MNGFAESITQKQPVAWTHKPDSSNRVLHLLGHVEDFKQKAFRILLLNAVHWTLELPCPGKSRFQIKNISIRQTAILVWY